MQQAQTGDWQITVNEIFWHRGEGAWSARSQFVFLHPQRWRAYWKPFARAPRTRTLETWMPTTLPLSIRHQSASATIALTTLLFVPIILTRNQTAHGIQNLTRPFTSWVMRRCNLVLWYPKNVWLKSIFLKNWAFTIWSLLLSFFMGDSVFVYMWRNHTSILANENQRSMK